MITWLLLVTLFCKSTQGGHADANSEYVLSSILTET